MGSRNSVDSRRCWSDVWTGLRDFSQGRTPTTAAGVDRVVALLIVGIRLGTLVQMAPSLAVGLTLSPNRPLYAASFLIACAASLVVTVRVLRQDERLSGTAYVLDVGLAVGLLLLGDLCVPGDQRLGTWVGFQPGYALSVLCSGAGVRNSIAWVLSIVGVSAADIYFRLPQITAQNLSTTIGNVLTYVVLVAVARFAIVFTRRIAADGDAARATAAELARREEERRAQLAIHNGAAVMRLLADPALDPQVRSALQTEARREADRMRSYLQGHPAPGNASPDGPTRLVEQVRQTCARYGDLPLHAALDLADDVIVSQRSAAAIDHALAALLLNIRDHAAATRVVVHGDAAAGHGHTEWVVTVHDDGQGFDPDPTQWGVGLREVVHGQLTALGVEVNISSSPGVGSTAILRGRGLATQPPYSTEVPRD